MKVELIGLDRDQQNGRSDINIGWVFRSSSNKIKHDFSWTILGGLVFDLLFTGYDSFCY